MCFWGPGRNGNFVLVEGREGFILSGMREKRGFSGTLRCSDASLFGAWVAGGVAHNGNVFLAEK